MPLFFFASQPLSEMKEIEIKAATQTAACFKDSELQRRAASTVIVGGI